MARLTHLDENGKLSLAVKLMLWLHNNVSKQQAGRCLLLRQAGQRRPAPHLPRLLCSKPHASWAFPPAIMQIAQIV